VESPAVTVNGRSVPLADAGPHTTALEWLREQGLTGCKEGCAEGECGACAVLVTRPGAGTATEWTAVNACLLPVAALDGQEVVTAEGLGTPDDLHPVQAELAGRGGSQCGFCTPGFVCSMAAEYYRPDRRSTAAPTAERGGNGFDLHAIGGNLCRCTGYRPIRDAAFALGAPADGDPLAARSASAPPPARATRIVGAAGEFVRPADLAGALALLSRRPDATVVAGSTDWGVAVNLLGARAPLTVAVEHLPELRVLLVDGSAVQLGAALSLTEVETGLAGRVPLLDELLPQFASRLIRNRATIGGNLGTGSPIGDLAPALLALDATVVLVSARGERELPLSDYFTGYRTSVRAEDELVRAVRIPLPLATTSSFQKVAKRRYDDISSVAVAFALDIADGVVRRARIGLGGVAAVPLRARATERALTGRVWDRETVEQAARVLSAEGSPIDDHRASAAYRAAMLGQALRRLLAQTTTAEVPA
jgi:xanthine dehydrogenase small subunit